MKLGQQFLVLRYGINFVDDCMEKHREVIKAKGSCWFGKIGMCPSKKVIETIMRAEEPTVILYSRQGIYEGRLIGTSVERPYSNYPDYYNEYLFDNGTYPSIYFLFDMIEKIEKSDLAKCTVVKSGNLLLDTLAKSMSSFFFAELPDLSQKKEVKVKKMSVKL